MLFIGTITRLIEGDRYKHNQEPVAYPVAVAVSMPPQKARCSCRVGVLCSEGSNHSRDVRITTPMVAAAPVLSHHDTRRQWRYERRAMRDYHRAARHGYGYRQLPITIPVTTIHGAGQDSYAPDTSDNYQAGSSTSRALPDHRRERYSEDNWLAARDASGASRTQKVQHEAPPPRYEAVSGDLDP